MVPDDELTATAETLAEKIASGPTLAYGGVKRLMHGSLEHTLDQHLAQESEEMAKAGRSADGIEGVTAFVEKRAANFRGR